MKLLALIIVFIIFGSLFLWMIYQGINTPVSSSTDSPVFDEIRDKLNKGEK